MSRNWYRKSGVYDLHSRRTLPQHIKVVQTSSPTLTIVTTAEMKNYLKLSSDTTDDNLVGDIIKAAQTVLENALGGLALCEQEFKQYQTGGVDYIELLKHPVFGVPTVSYCDDFDQVTATNITYSSYFKVVENNLYHADGFFEEGREGDGYTVTFKAGKYTAGNVSSADPALKTYVYRMGAFLYENREEFVSDVREENYSVTYDYKSDPAGVKYLLMPFHQGSGII